jgi:hypothetical protein
VKWALAAAAVLVVAISAVLATSGAHHPAAAARAPSTVAAERGELSAMVSQAGTLAYRARSDGSPYAAINQARGVYTQLPDAGDRIGCGRVLYRVDDKPVRLLCGTIPAYRALHVGMHGRDVRQVNRNLHLRGDVFTAKTERAIGTLALGDVVFLPEAVRVAKVTAELGGAAQPGTLVLKATSDTLHVQVNLDPSQQGEVRRGDRTRITLPGNRPLAGRVAGFGRVAETPAGQGSTPADATIPTFISLDRPAKARGLDKAPVQVDITTKGVNDALSVPVTALLGKAGGGFAVEVVRPGERRGLVAVRLGLFDTGSGRVQVEGALREGDRVVVPAI